MNYIPMQPQGGNSTLERAKLLAALGYAVFPLQQANKRPHSNESVAAALGIAPPSNGQGGVYFATRDAAAIQRLWAAFPDARIGIATGARSSGLVVLDVDRKNGKDSFATLAAQGFGLHETAWQQTPSGGFHYLYRDLTGKHLPNDAGQLGDALDRRGDAGYIVDYGFNPFQPLGLPPEWLLSGSHGQRTRQPLGEPSLAAPSFEVAIEILNSYDPNDLGRDEWLKATAAFKQSTASFTNENAKQAWEMWCGSYVGNAPAENNKVWNSIKDAAAGFKTLLDGSPNKATYYFGAGNTVNITPSPAARTYEQILEDAHTLSFDPIDADKVEHLCIEAGGLAPIKKDAVLRAIRNQTQLSLATLRSQANQAGAEAEADHLHLARKTIAAIGANNLIHAEQFTWQFTNTGVWKRCDDRELKQRVQSTMDADHLTVISTRVSGVAEVLKNEIYKPQHQFNLGNPETVNCLNGELELQNGQWVLLPHRRELYRTTQIPVAYDPAAAAPLFWHFLNSVFEGDADRNEKITVVLEMVGYSLMSHANREKFILLIGTGANGKSVLLATLEALLGRENVAGVQPANFDSKFQRAHMHQKLANIVTELKQGETIADAELKAITSGEPATVENKNQNPFVMRPFATCWFGTNHMPHTRDYSDAFFRRAIVLTFNRVFKPHEQDTGLKDKLVAELPGILNSALWAYAGVVANNRFTLPASAREAEAKWQLEANQVAQFVEACCTPNGAALEAVETLYNAYRVWGSNSGIRQLLGKNHFGDRLEQLGYARTKGNAGKRMIAGIGFNLFG